MTRFRFIPFALWAVFVYLWATVDLTPGPGREGVVIDIYKADELERASA